MMENGRMMEDGRMMNRMMDDEMNDDTRII